MTKKLLIFIIILAALLILYFIYNYFTQPTVKAPTIEDNRTDSSGFLPKGITTSTNFKPTDFKGPTGPPSVKGPTGPPPSQ